MDINELRAKLLDMRRKHENFLTDLLVEEFSRDDEQESHGVHEFLGEFEEDTAPCM